MTRCYLGLGSNLRHPQRQLRCALKQLRTLDKSVIIAQSRLYATKPWGVRWQPTYVNMVVAIETQLPPHTLLRHCQAIETKQQRLRKIRWGARTLDIDVLLYGTKTIQTPTLTIPHPRMFLRDFVLIPLLDIAPDILK